MADIIKDFVKKQTTSINIGVPKQRSAGEPERRIEPERLPVQVPVQSVAPESATPRHVGRQKSEVSKVKLSLYLPEETKAKLIKVQHMNCKASLNDMLMEAVEDVLKKYGE